MRLIALFTAAGVALATTGTAKAERIYGLTFDNRIVTFNASAPATILRSRSITGLVEGESLLGIDVRPANQMLYALGATGNLYELTLSGGNFAATSMGVLTTLPMGNAFGIDFNPVPDRLRVVSDTGQNLRINPDNGATIVDGTIMSDTGNAMLVGAAYTNNFAGATSTVLYAIDVVSGGLLRSTDPNGGIYTGTNLMGMAFQPLGFDFTVQNAVGFDISGLTGRAFANVDSLFWEVDLTSGVATSIGIIGSGPIRSIATSGVVPEPATWAMLIGGFGLVGSALRRRRTGPATTFG
jgi:hypothetical protein